MVLRLTCYVDIVVPVAGALHLLLTCPYIMHALPEPITGFGYLLFMCLVSIFLLMLPCTSYICDVTRTSSHVGLFSLPRCTISVISFR